MFKQVIKPLVATATIIVGTLAAAAPANAGTNFGIYFGNGPHNGVYIGNAQRPRMVHRVHKRHCSPRRALKRAYHLGVWNPHIARVNHKKIVVRGFHYGHPAKVVFKRSHRGCKIIKTRGL